MSHLRASLINAKVITQITDTAIPGTFATADFHNTNRK